MTTDQKLHTGSQSNKIVNSHDGWAHVYTCPGYKTFYSVHIHHFKGGVETIGTFQHHSDAVDLAMALNEGDLLMKQPSRHKRNGKLIRE